MIPPAGRPEHGIRARRLDDVNENLVEVEDRQMGISRLETTASLPFPHGGIRRAMIEIFILISLSKNISARAKSQGRSGVPFVFLLLGLWFGGEIGGGIAGGLVSLMMDPTSEPDFLLCYLGAIACAVIGAVIAFKIVGPLETGRSESRLEIRDRDLPVLKERWNDRRAEPDDGRGSHPDGEEKYKPGSR
jgi:hypothetical protein